MRGRVERTSVTHMKIPAITPIGAMTRSFILTRDAAWINRQDLLGNSQGIDEWCMRLSRLLPDAASDANF